MYENFKKYESLPIIEMGQTLWDELNRKIEVTTIYAHTIIWCVSVIIIIIPSVFPAYRNTMSLGRKKRGQSILIKEDAINKSFDLKLILKIIDPGNQEVWVWRYIFNFKVIQIYVIVCAKILYLMKKIIWY